MFRSIIKFCCFLLLSFTLSLAPLAQAQESPTNALNISIPVVTKDGKNNQVQKTNTNTFQYSGELTLDDAIKYAWDGVDLNLKYVDKPAKGGGYLKVYLNDDSTENNLITNFGSSPMPIKTINSKLKEGDNKILLVFIDYTGKPAIPLTKISFSFKFKNTTTAPQIKVLEPADNSIFMKNVDRDIVLQLQNFSLEINDSGQKNRGKVNIYHNQVQQENFLGTVTLSKDLGDNKAEVRFSSKDYGTEFSHIPDNKDTKLIFVLTKGNGELLDTKAEVKVRTNYNNTINVNLPKISFIEPRKDRTNLNADGDQKFIVQADNFQILTERKDGPNEPGQGYLQIIVDDIPRQIVYPKTDFSLNEIKYSDTQEGRKSIKVQLVNKDFTKLNPEAQDAMDIIYIPKQTDKAANSTNQVENNTWRIVIIVLTIVLVVGGIAVIITRG